MNRILFLAIMASIAGQARAMNSEDCSAIYKAALLEACHQIDSTKPAADQYQTFAAKDRAIAAQYHKCLNEVKTITLANLLTHCDAKSSEFQTDVKVNQKALKECAVALQTVAKACKNGQKSEGCFMALNNYSVALHKYNVFAREIVPNRANTDDLFFTK